jgi:hypothetical protein
MSNLNWNGSIFEPVKRVENSAISGQDFALMSSRHSLALESPFLKICNGLEGKSMYKTRQSGRKALANLPESKSLIIYQMPRRPLLHALCLALSRPPISFFKKGLSNAYIAGYFIM